MPQDKIIYDLADRVKALFQESRGEFRPRDFIQVADLMGFHAVEKSTPDSKLKPRAENNLPDIIGTNLQYAVGAYHWTTHLPMTDDGVIVSGFYERGKDPMPPAGYVMVDGALLKQ